MTATLRDALSFIAVTSTAAFALFAAPGCSSCTDILISHRIEMARDFDVPTSDVSALQVTICAGTSCIERSAGSDGRLDVSGERYITSATLMADAATNHARIDVEFTLDEGDTSVLRITVRDAAAATVYESKAAVLWKGGECHPDPVWRKV